MAARQTGSMSKWQKGMEPSSIAAATLIAFLVFLLVLYFWYKFQRGSGGIPVDINQITQILGGHR